MSERQKPNKALGTPMSGRQKPLKALGKPKRTKTKQKKIKIAINQKNKKYKDTSL